MSDNPFYRQTMDELFADGVKWIAVADDRLCPSGMMAFGYPEDKYGYLTFTEIEPSDIPYLRGLCFKHGMQLNDQRDALNFRYCVPGAKWWTDFPENFVVVK